MDILPLLHNTLVNKSLIVINEDLMGLVYPIAKTYPKDI